MKLVSIPGEKYREYRLNLIFDGYKWDPQFLDSNTVAPYVLVLTQKEHEELLSLTEALDKETRAAEECINKHPELIKQLYLPRRMRGEIKWMQNYDAKKHIRLTRYDFHPTTEDKWAVSEVNSDVPGGFAESSIMPKIALEALRCGHGKHTVEGAVSTPNNASTEEKSVGAEKLTYINFSNYLIRAIEQKVRPGGRIMLVHCTSYSDDRQVMQFLGDALKEKGFQVLFGAGDHVRFRAGKAYSILDGNEGELDMVFRYTPIEWLIKMRPKRWQGYFYPETVFCNHAVSVYAQTKRFPLVWDALEAQGISMGTWRELLPETLEVKQAKGKEGFLYKPALGRVGEKISIPEACRGDEYKKILKDVKRHPKCYLAQKRFESKPLLGENGEKFHVCLGSYAVEGKHAGYYARISRKPRIDSDAADIPVVIEERKTEND